MPSTEAVPAEGERVALGFAKDALHLMERRHERLEAAILPGAAACFGSAVAICSGGGRRLLLS